MASSKEERLVNLVICLLSTRYFVPADKIRAAVAGYRDCTSDEAFSRMFERDKSELRDLGVPLETGRASAFDTVDGYRINRAAYELPDIELTAEETTAVAVAIQMWHTAKLAGVMQDVLVKLRAAGVEVDPASADGVVFAAPAALPGIHGSEQALSALLDAINARQVVRFGHRPSSAEPYVTRTVEPWGIVTDLGRWYLVGRDRDRDAVRIFRLSRIGPDVVALGSPGAVEVPAGTNLRGLVTAAVAEKSSGAVARVWLASGRANALRRAGRIVEQVNRDGRRGEVVEIDVSATGQLCREIAGHGADAVVLEPAELRAEVLVGLRAQTGSPGESAAKPGVSARGMR